MFKNAKVGDRVFSLIAGWVNIVEVEPTRAYPVKTSDGRCYTLEGFRHIQHVKPLLYWDENLGTTRPEPEIPIDTKVLVWDSVPSKKWPMHYAGKYRVWEEGKTSYTTTIAQHWRHMELAEPVGDLPKGYRIC